MEKTMLNELSITVEPERLDEGSSEERACFAALAIKSGGVSLTEGHDGFINKVRAAPLLSAYHLAEWMAWHWWRLCWEPHSSSPGWDFSHRLATIGEGYVWPNITIFSDWERVALVATPTRGRPSTSFRYLSDGAVVVGAREFEYAMDRFIEQVRGLLRDARLGESNLDKIWADLSEERADPDLGEWRMFEAILGYDPDRSDDAAIESMISAVSAFGKAAAHEIAADFPKSGTLLTVEELRAIAVESGFHASLRDTACLARETRLPSIGEVPAWQYGAEGAKLLREQHALGNGRMNNDSLASLVGVETRVLTDSTPGPSISFALDSEDGGSRVVLRSKWTTGRRFDIARLLGDRILSKPGKGFFPATRADTYRQKMQRSFAAELLSPFEGMEELLLGDYSMESQQSVAEHFEVSGLLIRTQLVNHRKVDREELEVEIA